MTQIVLFVCPHGVAKSVIARAYFQHLVDQDGLRVASVAAGIEVFTGDLADQFVRSVDLPRAIHLLTEPGQEGACSLCCQSLVKLRKDPPQCLVDLGPLEIAQGIGREVAKLPERPLNILQHTYRIGEWGEAQIRLIVLIPEFGHLGDLQRSIDQPLLELAAYYGPGWGGMLWMGLNGLFWLLLLGLAIWSLVRWITRQQTAGNHPLPWTPPSPLSAMEILRQRYARSELDTETFEAMRAHLEETHVPDDRLQHV